MASQNLLRTIRLFLVKVKTKTDISQNARIIICGSLYVQNFVLDQEVFPSKTQKQLRHRDGVFFAIGHNAVNVFFYVIHLGHLAAVYVAFGRGNAQNFGK
jgi:hypothetical protein